MKPILLVTLWDYSNFGNRVQAIALKYLIESLGYDVICAVPSNLSKKAVFERRIKSFLGFVGVKRFRKNYYWDKRCEKYKKSSDKLLAPITSEIRNYHTKNVINPDDFAAAVSGSDQVWHGGGVNEDKNLSYFYLSFMPEDKRISYAASFGFEEFPYMAKERHLYGLNHMKMISCREVSGCNLISQATNKNCALVLDPTICVGSEFWISIEEKPKIRLNSDFILTFFLGDSKKYNSEIQRYAATIGARIVDVFSMQTNEVWKFTIGNILWLIHHARFVFTDSFHCCVFSVIFERDFLAYHRYQSGFENMFGRIANFLSICGLEECEYKDYNGIVDHHIDYKEVKKRISLPINESKLWLKFALDTVVHNNTDAISSCENIPQGIAYRYDPLSKAKEKEQWIYNNPTRVCATEKCTSCFACMNKCPVNAIKKEISIDGRSLPIIDPIKCIKCNSCHIVCPQMNSPVFFQAQKCYAAQWNRIEERKQSASGGIGMMLAEYIIHSGGYYVGAMVDDDIYLRHHCTNDILTARKMQSSKYVSSSIETVYQDIKDIIENGRSVLFTGTPCQVAGLRNYLGKKNDLLTCVDIVCHGAPPFEFFRQHINSKVENADNYTFRGGNEDYHLRIACDSCVIYDKKWIYDEYYYSFLKDAILPENCQNCSFAKSERVGDLTIGDFWGLNKKSLNYSMDGRISLVLINSDKGMKLWNSIQDSVICEERPIMEAINGNPTLQHPNSASRFTESFIKAYIESGDFIKAFYNSNIGKDYLVNLKRQNWFWKMIRAFKGCLIKLIKS